MTALRLTAIMKTDIGGSTPRFRALSEGDLAELLAEHREFVSRLAAMRDGQIVKAEGDAFWITFPSVTAAARVAMAMQEELRRVQSNKGDDRLAMRIVITLGDVLHEEGDFFGDAVALAVRIEALTPVDEIYLSPAARLAVNQAEVRTALVDTFALKGFAEPVPIYRVEQTHRTQVITDQYIVFTDLRGFTRFTETAGMTSIERLLDRLMELNRDVCLEFGGTHRFNTGDASCMTFSDAVKAITASERLAREWDAFDRREHLGCPMVAALHKGVLHLFRSYLYSGDVNIVSAMIAATRNLSGSNSSIFVTGPLRRELAVSPWDGRLQLVDLEHTLRHLAGIEIFRLERTNSL